MSTVKSKKLQVGTDASASNNFTIYQPATPDGTLRIGVGNADSPTEVARFDSIPSYSARAWVNFNGTSTVSIRGSGNVTSITDNGTGDYTVNFTTVMPDANYAVSVATQRNGINSAVWGSIKHDSTLAASNVRIATVDVSPSYQDPLSVCVSIFR